MTFAHLRWALPRTAHLVDHTHTMFLLETPAEEVPAVTAALQASADHARTLLFGAHHVPLLDRRPRPPRRPSPLLDE